MNETSIRLVRSDEKCLIGLMQNIDPHGTFGSIADDIKAFITEHAPNRNASSIKIYKSRRQLSFNVALAETRYNTGNYTQVSWTFLHEKLDGLSEDDIAKVLEGFAKDDSCKEIPCFLCEIHENENG